MIGPGGSIQLMRVFGIRIGVNPSWFLVLFIFIFWLSGSFRATLNSSDTTAYATAVAAALLFFVSLILHELGHALVAKRNGIDDRRHRPVVLRRRRPHEPRHRLPGRRVPRQRRRPAGHAAGRGRVLRDRRDRSSAPRTSSTAPRLQNDAASSPGVLLVSFLASINALVFLFNLIPAFPLDGGRIARAIAWKVTGDRSEATKVAAGLGQVFAWILMGVGVVWLLTLRLADRPVLARAGVLPAHRRPRRRSCRRTSRTASPT